jgi:hypothetical protein
MIQHQLRFPYDPGLYVAHFNMALSLIFAPFLHLLSTCGTSSIKDTQTHVISRNMMPQQYSYRAQSGLLPYPPDVTPSVSKK